MAMTDDVVTDATTDRGDDGVRMIDGVELTPKTDLYFRTPAEIDSDEDERLHRKQKLAGALRIFG
jgi:hypothetical protein